MRKRTTCWASSPGNEATCPVPSRIWKTPLKCNRANAQTWQHLADVHTAAGNTAAAITHYEQSLRLRPDIRRGAQCPGTRLEEDQSLGGSGRLLSQGDSAQARLGGGLQQFGQRAFVLKVCKTRRSKPLSKRCGYAPDNPDIAYNLGTLCHIDMDNVALAIGYYRQALAQKPPYAAEVCNSLGTALKEQGALDEAIAQFREALRLSPDHAMASYNLSELVAGGRHDFTPSELEKIKDRMRSGKLSPADRVLHGFALGTVLDKQKAYEEAFGFFREANDLQRRILEESKAAFDPRHHEAQVANIIALYDGAFFAKTKDWGTDSELPVFIVGMPRSGSTLVEQIIASHPRVFGWGESGDMHRFYSHSAPMPAGAAYEPLHVYRCGARRRLADAYVRRLTEVGNGAVRVTNKSLENVAYLGLIAALFPRARIIHCRRHPLDTCVSCYFKRFQAIPFTWSLEDLGVYYRSYEKLMAHWTQVLPIPIHEVSYEELIAHQEAVSRELIRYCGLEWDERCLDFHKTRRVVRTASAVAGAQTDISRCDRALEELSRTSWAVGANLGEIAHSRRAIER